MLAREVASAGVALAFVVLATLACGTGRGRTSPMDGGVVSPPPPARGTRIDCGYGGRYAPCPTGQECLFDAPGCHSATGYCGTPTPECVVATAYCGCGTTVWVCGWPTTPWMYKGALCTKDGGPGGDAAAGP